MSLSTSFLLSNAVTDAMLDDSVKTTAGLLVGIHESLDQEAFMQFLYEYSANLVSVTAERITKVFMTEEEIKTMIAEAMEFQKLSAE